MAAAASPGGDGSDADIPNDDEIRGRSISPEREAHTAGAEVPALPTTVDQVTRHVGFNFRAEILVRVQVARLSANLLV